jgi:hypothetical protein
MANVTRCSTVDVPTRENVRVEQPIWVPDPLASLSPSETAYVSVVKITLSEVVDAVVKQEVAPLAFTPPVFAVSVQVEAADRTNAVPVVIGFLSCNTPCNTTNASPPSRISHKLSAYRSAHQFAARSNTDETNRLTIREIVISRTKE